MVPATDHHLLPGRASALASGYLPAKALPRQLRGLTLTGHRLRAMWNMKK
jgi:hypothetical protein